MRTTHIPCGSSRSRRWYVTLSPLSVALAYQMASLGILVRGIKNDSLTRMMSMCRTIFGEKKKDTHTYCT